MSNSHRDGLRARKRRTKGGLRATQDVSLDQETMLALGYAASERKDWSEAIQCWAQVCKAFPEIVDGYVHGAFALASVGEFGAADAIMDEAMSRFPGKHSVIMQRSYIPVIQRNWPEAVRRWRFVLERFPEDKEAIDALRVATHQAQITLMGLPDDE
jgi:tetratricopeptide (TPR) repeat protein